MAFVDTNVILRYLLNDHPELSPKAEALVEASPKAGLVITDLILAEVVYVLRSTGRDRVQTVEALLFLSRTDAFKYENEELVIEVIRLFEREKLDVADCYLLARSKREGQSVETLDAALRKRL